MKKSILFIVALELLATTIQAAPITIGNIDNIYLANNLIGTSSVEGCTTSESTTTTTSCDFTNTPGTFLTNNEVATIVTSYDPDDASYVLSPHVDSSYIELGFINANNQEMVMSSGAGNDLVVFFAGNTTSFGLDVFDEAGNSINNNTYFVSTPTFSTDSEGIIHNENPGDTVFDTFGNWLCVDGAGDFCTGGSALSAIFIDLDAGLGDPVTVGSMRISLGKSFIDYEDPNSTNPRLLFAGGLHAPATVVPLPLPVVLFSSGLALLGWVGRRKAV